MNNNLLKGKKLLIIGGATQHIKVVKAAHKMGIETYVVDNVIQSPAKLIADHSYEIDIYNIEELVRLCHKEKIDGAITTSLDACQMPYAQLCRKMGYYSFESEEIIEKLINKNEFKKICKLYNVDVIPEYDMEDIEKERIIYPVFVKPTDSRGSRGQRVCYNEVELRDAIRVAINESISGKYIIERYMTDCRDFTVSYLVLNGNPLIVRTGDRFEGENGIENLCVASVSPSSISQEYLKTAHKNVADMINVNFSDN